MLTTDFASLASLAVSSAPASTRTVLACRALLASRPLSASDLECAAVERDIRRNGAAIILSIRSLLGI
jgi:hypothetical protein